jgi:serine/threonine-protein kinase RsbT
MIAEVVERFERRIFVRHESDVTMARKWTRELALREGIGTSAAEAFVTAVSEVARNALVHAGGGEVVLSRIEEGPRRGVSAVTRDEGPGIRNLEQAMRDGFSTGDGLGLGLSSARRLVSEFELVSSEGKGTTVILRQWKPS